MTLLTYLGGQLVSYAELIVERTRSGRISLERRERLARTLIAWEAELLRKAGEERVG